MNGDSKMIPGPELDAFVAKRVMGLTGVECRYSDSVDEWLATYDHHTGAHLMRKTIPPYSTDIAAAWAVMEKLRMERGGFFLQGAIQ
jgi:hypothetical protein